LIPAGRLLAIGEGALFLGAPLVCFCTVSQPASTPCAGLDPGPIRQTAEAIQSAGVDPAPTIDVIHDSETRPGGDPARITIVARGPVLGSMDSPNVEAHLECVPGGLRLTAIIARSEAYQGAAAKNVLWRPRLEWPVHLRQMELKLEVTWQQRPPRDERIDRSPAPPSSPPFPIVVTKTIR
jgi:hypothetical protein